MHAAHVLVTGASTGIGRAIALEFDAAGWHVLAGVRREADAHALRAAASPRLRPILLDVTSEDDIQAAAAVVSEATGSLGLAALVNNAGTNLSGAFEYTAPDQARALLDLNLFGLARVTQVLLPALRAAARTGRPATVVNVGSIGSVISVPWEVWYHASKWAVLGLTYGLRHELWAEGVRVTAVLPGGVQTPFLAKSDEQMREALLGLPPDAPASYRRGLETLRSRVTAAERFGSSTERVATHVRRVVERRGRLGRSYVGVDSHLLRLVMRVLPPRARDWVMRRAFVG